MPKPAKTPGSRSIPLLLSFALLGSFACAKQSVTGVEFKVYSDWEETVCIPVKVRVKGQWVKYSHKKHKIHDRFIEAACREGWGHSGDPDAPPVTNTVVIHD